jgi:hypothetical protein
MTPITKRVTQLGAIALAIGLVAVETASAQYWGGGVGPGMAAESQGNGTGFSGLGITSASSAFGHRSVGGMLTSGGAGTFTGSNNIVTGQVTNFDIMANSGLGGIGNFQPSAFVGGGGVANGFVGGPANRGINANLAQPAGVNGLQYGAGQYPGGINVQFGGLYGNRNRNNPRNQLAEGQDIRSRSQIPIQVTYNVDFPVPSVPSSNVARKLSNELSSSPTIGAYGPVSVRLEGGTAILRGTVLTDHDRNLAAQVALLEPRVSQVRNELQVASAPTSP